MINLKKEIESARDRFDALWDKARKLSSPDSHFQEALQELSVSMGELETLQEELRSSNEELAAAWARTNAEQQRYQELFDFAPDGYLITDRHGTIQDLNLAAATLLNVRREHLIGKPFVIFIDPEKHQTFYLVLTDILRKGHMKDWQLEILPRRMLPVHAAATIAVKNLEEGELEFRWILRDVTASRALELELRARDEKYRSLFENSLIGICSSTPEGRFTAVNPALAKMLGYESPGEMLSLEIPQDLHMDAAERKRLLEEVDAAPEAALQAREVLLKKKDGRPLVASVSIRAIKNSAGKAIAYESQVQDITERKNLEERLRQRERLATVGATVAVLVHEISNPLTGMSATTEMMTRYVAKQDRQDENLKSFLDGLKTETQRLAVLLRDFRLLAQCQYRFEPIRFAEVVAEILNMQTGYDNRIKIEVDLPEGLPCIQADRNKLKQALLNLWKNAIEAMPNGGTLTLKTTTSDGRLVIEVKDTGNGVPAGINVFEAFTTTKENGTGLGLAIVQQVALAHGGAITYSSEPGRGTTFRLSLPVQFVPEKGNP
jgi:two-component system cell cycle sensor histidine kinase/response regulator CckA